jgi:hypothetical protein
MTNRFKFEDKATSKLAYNYYGTWTVWDSDKYSWDVNATVIKSGGIYGHKGHRHASTLILR